ncbi:glucosamine-6-phosphate deaminase [Tenuibacillus multivorans]|uniref:Glucosamine-6-phosphate deaminase n=1 Tax=Tenuibacillus multivorans TaxID=237069 RepID=A0A1H0C5Q3_9BACI|nr:glucosamine-6-phosphate deaminase [Tenuibacillus multivorans]GEL77775.1 glucosamine-6-phosphate deaminase 1 [Tenuibacillus multivorans]SDN53188.1 glucosamine-6-phosphate deaminase [Tenuibacillus multivorans]
MKKINVKSYEELSRIAAGFVSDLILAKPDATLGLATGSTPVGLYNQLIAMVQKRDIRFSQVKTFNLDEYVGLNRSHPQSYFRFMQEHLFEKVDIPFYQIHIPNGEAIDLQEECQRYERLIEENGPIDLQILGLGVNGHIGFNEPGTSFNSRTHVVSLAPSTREANARFFSSIEDVPDQAITMGIDTIMRSRHIVLLAYGDRKQEAIRRLFDGDVDEDFPASILKKHPNVTVLYG